MGSAAADAEPAAQLAGQAAAGRRRLAVREIAPEVLAWLTAHPADGDAEAPLFRNPRTGKRWSHWVLRGRWLEAVRPRTVH